MSETPPQPDRIDVQAHLGNANYAPQVKLLRIVWMFLQPVFRFSPRPLYGLRNGILRLMGAKVGKGVKVYPSARVFYPWNVEIGDHVIIGWQVEVYSLGKITIGNNVIISQRAHLCAGSHDYRKPNLPLLCPPIIIGSGTWICSDVFVSPNVSIGAGSVVAARAVVTKDLPENAIASGHPAKVIKTIKR